MKTEEPTGVATLVTKPSTEEEHRELRTLVRRLPKPEGTEELKQAMLSETRYLSVEQAKIITDTYRAHRGEPRVIQRAQALKAALDQMTIAINPGEWIVGNRTPGVRDGVVSPEAGTGWVERELDTLPNRPQDPFQVRPEDARLLREEIFPYWKGKSLEDLVNSRHGDAITEVAKVVKINQTDHAQGHIIPKVERWLALGPAGIAAEARAAAAMAPPEKRPFLEAVAVVYEGSVTFIRRYEGLARQLASERADSVGSLSDEEKMRLLSVADNCAALAKRPPETFYEAVQSIWFLFVILQMESNASSFSPGRMDQYLLPYLERDLEGGRIDLSGALRLVEGLWLSFNKIVYMRSAGSAEYFAGFPIGFNVAIGGVDRSGNDGTNLLSYLFLRAQEHLGMPQPNLSARLSKGSPDAFVDECARVIGHGSGMPQIVNDESIIPSQRRLGISLEDARDYAVVGCVELSTQGNNLGWSDAAMFNMVKALELALNDGVCLLTAEQMGPKTGLLPEMNSFEAVEAAYRKQLDYFFDRMIPLCDAVDRLHGELLPSPFLSGAIDDCLSKGMDVTVGGAKYNLSGIQAIQVANVADSLAALKELVFERGEVEPEALLQALRTDFEGNEELQKTLQLKAPKYGNDTVSVDELGNRWAVYFAHRLEEFKNARGGPYHMGLYTVSAHVPMGKNVGATPDGRNARTPLADGGMSPVYGRDQAGPTAVLKSVARINSLYASNGTLLNMKFLPRTFENREERSKFCSLLRSLVELGIHHAQFNVINRQILLDAQERPAEFSALTIRVAGYTAYFVELAPDLQDEIIARTTHGMD